MAAETDRKVMVGQRIRRFRRERGLSQAELAQQLGISHSYLNLIERNQRPATVQFLLRLGRAFDVDLQSFASDDEGRIAVQLKEVFSDPLFARLEISDQDVRDLAATSTLAGEAVTSLYRAYRAAMANGTGVSAAADPARSAFADVEAFLEGAGNYFAPLEEAAADIRAAAGLADPAEAFSRLAAHVAERHDIRVRVLPFDVMGETLRRFDRHGRRLLLSELMAGPSRLFQLAYQAGLLAHRDRLDAILEHSRLAQGDARRIGRIALANYLAAAVLMPYDPFLEGARTGRHDLDLLALRFGTSFEQVCHRLTTLQRPGAKGIPFFLARVDRGGNVTKRLSAAGFHFARFGGLCPRWDVFSAFTAPGRTLALRVQMPDGRTFLSLARRIERPSAAQSRTAEQVMIIGCDLANAHDVVYADGLDGGAPMPIGLDCRLCPRADCAARAHPPADRRLIVDENQRGSAPFFFSDRSP